MTDNVKKFMEIASNESDEFKEKLSKADKAEIIAIAAQKGITLTDEDFKPKDELSPDELEAVAGGRFLEPGGWRERICCDSRMGYFMT